MRDIVLTMHKHALKMVRQVKELKDWRYIIIKILNNGHLDRANSKPYLEEPLFPPCSVDTECIPEVSSETDIREHAYPVHSFFFLEKTI